MQEERVSLLYERSPTPLCRICYDGENLISCCECSGTQGYVHLKCLKRWVKDYSHDKTKCEICHSEWKVSLENKWEVWCENVSFCLLFYFNLFAPFLFFYTCVAYPENYEIVLIWIVCRALVGGIMKLSGTDEAMILHFVYSIVWYAIMIIVLIHPAQCELGRFWTLTVLETLMWVLLKIRCGREEGLAEI